MLMVTQPVSLFLFISAFFVAFAYFGTAALMVAELRRSNTDVWERLGRPSLGNYSITNGFSLTYFLYSRQYAKLNNKKLRILGNISIILGLISMCLLLAFFIITGGTKHLFSL